MAKGVVQVLHGAAARPHRLIARRPISAAAARVGGFHSVNPRALPPDPGLVAALPPVFALTEGLLPWRRLGAATVVLSADPYHASRHLQRLGAAFGPVRIAHAEAGPLNDMLARMLGRPLAAAAERCVPGPASCRTLPGTRLRRAALWGSLALLAVLLMAPLALLAALLILALGVLMSLAGLRLAAAVARLRHDRKDEGAEVVPARLPVVSVLVPLYREREIAHHLLARIGALDYPRDSLDLCLVLEDDDLLTRAAIEAAELPPWAKVIEVPEGTLRTKPRALNYALNFATGHIIGIYDAEDVPAPDHLRVVASHFARRGPETACLQGVLDFFNAERNWIARCFTLEYAGWFRVLLPGLARLGLAIPLGGTTLFLRREAIEAVGGWDAHNVTEDADLGIRLARHGFRTEMIPIVTMEEANARPWPWIKQRSRWLKGYAVTWAVHMRDPARLWRELGTWRFWGFQVMFLGTLLQFALAPLLWSFWLVPLGLPHPLAPFLPPAMLVAVSVLFLGTQALDLSYAWMGVRRAGRPSLALWAPALMLYFPLATLAVYRALWELVACPFRWDKTMHGLDAAPIPPPAPSPHRA